MIYSKTLSFLFVSTNFILTILKWFSKRNPWHFIWIGFQGVSLSFGRDASRCCAEDGKPSKNKDTSFVDQELITWAGLWLFNQWVLIYEILNFSIFLCIIPRGSGNPVSLKMDYGIKYIFNMYLSHIICKITLKINSFWYAK